MGTEISTCYQKRKDSDLNNLQEKVENTNQIELKSSQQSSKANYYYDKSEFGKSYFDSTSMISNSKQQIANKKEHSSSVSNLSEKSESLFKRMKFDEKENRFFIFERPQIIKALSQIDLNKLTKLNDKEIEEINEFFSGFFNEEEKNFVKNFPSIEEGFSIKGIIINQWDEEEKKKSPFEDDENFHSEGKEFNENNLHFSSEIQNEEFGKMLNFIKRN